MTLRKLYSGNEPATHGITCKYDQQELRRNINSKSVLYCKTSALAQFAILISVYSISTTPAFGNGGAGHSYPLSDPTGTPGAAGGIDGTLLEATGRQGLRAGGGGGAVDITTGNGAPGGAGGNYGDPIVVSVGTAGLPH